MNPKTVRVVGKTYTVNFVEKIDEKDSCGEQERDAQQIKIKINQHHESARETLLHEVIHAVEEQLSLGLKEKQVHCLAIGMFQVLNENPDLVKYLLEKSPKRKRRGN